MVVDAVALEDFVQTFEEKGPEVVYRSVVADLIENVDDIVKIRFYDLRVEL